MFLARKISRSKWRPHQDLAKCELQADAITGDLRTVGNALSVWRCGDEEPTKKDIKEAALAMASLMDRARPIDLAWFDRDELEQGGHKVQLTDGETNVPDLRSHHFDICGLDYARLGDIATKVAAAIDEGRYRRFTRREVLALLAEAIESDRLEAKDLKCQLRQEVQDSAETQCKPREARL